MTTLNPARIPCALCGQVALGHAEADGVRLCHATERSCYHRWTVYGARPGTVSTDGPFLTDITEPAADFVERVAALRGKVREG